MIISFHILPRTQPINDTFLDLRQVIILGPLSDAADYPNNNTPVLADLRNADMSSPWKGSVMLGGSTERLMRHWGKVVALAKLCHYVATPTGPKITEYVCLYLPNKTYIPFKCRIRHNGTVKSYVFPEQIDRFAASITNEAWFQSPALTVLAGQTGCIDEDYENVINVFFDYFYETMPAANMLSADHYDHHQVQEQLTRFLTDVQLLCTDSNTKDVLDIYSYWVNQFVPVLNEKDFFLDTALTKAVLSQKEITHQFNASPFDTAPAAPILSQIDGRMRTVPNFYLPIAEQLERLPYTDMIAYIECPHGQFSTVIVESVIDRFASTVLISPVPIDYHTLSAIFLQLYRLYEIHYTRPNIVLTKIRIIKSFNEEAVLEFYHQTSQHDYAIYVDFALLSYCSAGLGRFFNSKKTWPH